MSDREELLRRIEHLNDELNRQSDLLARTVIERSRAETAEAQLADAIVSHQRERQSLTRVRDDLRAKNERLRAALLRRIVSLEEILAKDDPAFREDDDRFTGVATANVGLRKEVAKQKALRKAAETSLQEVRAHYRRLDYAVGQAFTAAMVRSRLNDEVLKLTEEDKRLLRQQEDRAFRRMLRAIEEVR